VYCCVHADSTHVPDSAVQQLTTCMSVQMLESFRPPAVYQSNSMQRSTCRWRGGGGGTLSAVWVG
jgi:hypothetical protein